MNLETKIIIYKFTPQVFTLTRNLGYIISNLDTYVIIIPATFVSL